MKKLLLSITALCITFGLFAQTDLIISEYVEGWSNNKALEIYNPTNAAIQLSNYRITRYSNGSDVPPADNQWAITLPEFSLEAYKSYVVVLDKRDPDGEGQEAPVWTQLQERADAFLCPVYSVSKALYFNGDDGVALEKTDGTLVDLFARWGAPRPAEAVVGGSDLNLRCWTDTPPHFDGAGVGITADHTMVKKSSISVGVTTNPTIWDPMADWDTLPANTFSSLGWHKCDVAPSNSTPVFGSNEYKFALESTSENGTLVGTITTTDTENDDVKYYINYGNFVYMPDGTDTVRIEPFELEKTTGKLTLVDKTGLDAAVLDTFNIFVVATDGYSQTEEVLIQVLVDGEVGVNESLVTNNVTIWPNPTADNLINISANKEIKNITLSNLIGQTIFTKEQLNSSFSNISIDDITKGVYIVKITMIDDTISTAKVIFK